MKLAQNDFVQFFEFGHKYFTKEGKELIGVTTLMSKHGLSADYKGASDAALAHAAELGTQAHQAIEDYIDGKAVEEIPLITSFRKLNLNSVCCEYLVSDNETVASKIDIVIELADGVVGLVDMKRTSSVHRDALAWQLGIYKYLFERQNPGLKVGGCWCLPIKKGNKDDILADTCKKLVEITPVTETDVIALLASEKGGVLFKKYEGNTGIADVLGEESRQLLVATVTNIAQYESYLKAEKEKLDTFKRALYDYMTENGVDEIMTEEVKIKLKASYERASVDTAKLKKLYPAITEEVTKTITVEGGVTITLNK